MRSNCIGEHGFARKGAQTRNQKNQHANKKPSCSRLYGVPENAESIFGERGKNAEGEVDAIYLHTRNLKHLLTRGRGGEI